jgi:uncharacterized protein with PQ loop repeat
MTNAEILVQLLGLAAGAIVCISALPRVKEIWRDPKVAAGESVKRNMCLVAGNVLWVIYGTLMGAPAIAIMCAISAILNGIILWATFHANGSRPRTSFLLPSARLLEILRAGFTSQPTE